MLFDGQELRDMMSRTSNEVQRRNEHGSPVVERERAARVALEAYAGRPLSDLEWDQARSGLIEFVSTLRSWRQKGTTYAREFPEAA